MPGEEVEMFGYIRKKELMKRMKEVKDSNRAGMLYKKHLAESEEQVRKNCYSQGFEDGTDNFYHALESFCNNN